MNLALDLDGTLITCEPRQSAVLQAAKVSVGAQFDVDRVWPLKRIGASTEHALVQIGVDLAVAKQVADHWQRMIEQPGWLALDSVQPGVFGVLDKMRAQASRLVLITARSRSEFVRPELSQLGLAKFFDEIIVVSPRTTADAKATCLRQKSMHAFFGDTESDWMAARTAGVPFYALTTGQRSASFLLRAGITESFDDLAGAWNDFLKTMDVKLGKNN